jgi:AbrB family looped-hinge helix DNA binding protein
MSYAIELTSLSSKGQVVIPQEIRNALHLESGSKFVVIADDEGIYLKPVAVPERHKLLKLMEKTRKFASEAGITQAEINDTIAEVRKEDREARENSH